MKTLRFIGSYISETIRRNPVTVLLIVICTVVGGYLSSVVYGLMKMEVGSVARMFVPTYTVSYDGEKTEVSEFLRFADILAEYDPYAERGYDAASSELQYIEMSVCFNDGTVDEVFGGRVIVVLYPGDIMDRERIDRADTVTVPAHIAEAYGISEGDVVSFYGARLTVSSVEEDILYPAVSYKTATEAMTSGRTEFSFVPNRKLSEADKEAFGALGLSEQSQTYRMPFLFILCVLLCALNTLMSTRYISKRARKKYSVAKMLGAGNGTIAAAMLIEQALYALVGTFIGVGIAAAVVKSAGYFGFERAFALTAGDIFCIAAANLLLIIATGAYSVIKRARAVPCAEV